MGIHHFICALASIAALACATPLDDYVWAEDEHYNWVDTGMTISGRNKDGSASYTAYLLNMTSQQWLTEADCDRSIWWHQLLVIVPSNLNPAYKDNATLWITGGSNTQGWPAPTDEDVLVTAALAMGTGTITGALFQIPNEHIVFTSDPIQKSRTEDAIIAFTWDHFLRDPSDPTWLVRFPMVKASLRAMDAITEFVATSTLPQLQGWTAGHYTVSGASKRGWTTWLVGAVDPSRVAAIAPIVLDALNFVQFAHHQYKSYGGWSFALADYYDMNITSRFDSANMVLLSELVDPYFYLDRLTMPTMVVNAVGDEFQQPDDTHYWWSELPEPKHFLMVPNAEHSLATGIFEAVPAIGTWVNFLLNSKPVPTMTWEMSSSPDNATSTITLTLENNAPQGPAVMVVRKFWTVSWGGNKRRDFRFLNLDDPCEGVASDGTCLNDKVFWHQEDLQPVAGSGGLVYEASHGDPGDGTYAAFFIDVVYEDPRSETTATTTTTTKTTTTTEEVEVEGSFSFSKLPEGWPELGGASKAAKLDVLPHKLFPRDLAGQLEFTSEVSIVPDTFPFADCSGVDCYGVLV